VRDCITPRAQDERKPRQHSVAINVKDGNRGVVGVNVCFCSDPQREGEQRSSPFQLLGVEREACNRDGSGERNSNLPCRNRRLRRIAKCAVDCDLCTCSSAGGEEEISALHLQRGRARIRCHDGGCSCGCPNGGERD
jgi:hypothetical protein